jgi:hypothetical protein
MEASMSTKTAELLHLSLTLQARRDANVWQSDAHVFEHPLAQRADGLLAH